METTPASLAAAFVLGLCVGSFLNVVIYRLPRGRSIVWPRSFCPSCARSIPPWQNVPLVSWVALRGRCARCQARISARYPLVEGLTGLIFAALLWKTGPELRLLVEWLLASALVAVTFIDLEHRIIPNAITFPGIPLGLAFAGLLPPPGLLSALLGLLVAGGLMYAVSTLYLWRTGVDGLGMGDVKLVAMLGAFLGLPSALSIMVLGSLLGLVAALLLIATRRAGRRTAFPFGPALATAALVHLFHPRLLPW